MQDPTSGIDHNDSIWTCEKTQKMKIELKEPTHMNFTKTKTQRIKYDTSKWPRETDRHWMDLRPRPANRSSREKTTGLLIDLWAIETSLQFDFFTGSEEGIKRGNAMCTTIVQIKCT